MHSCKHEVSVHFRIDVNIFFKFQFTLTMFAVKLQIRSWPEIVLSPVTQITQCQVTSAKNATTASRRIFTAKLSGYFIEVI